MKKPLVVTGTVFVLALGWLTLIGRNVQQARADDVSGYVTFAQEQAKLEAYGSAIANMKKAVSIRNTRENRLLLAHVYRDGGYADDYKTCMEGLIHDYPDETSYYKELGDYYYHVTDFKECCDVLKGAMKRGIQTPEMEDMYYDCAFRYVIKGGAFDNISNSYNNICVAEDEGRYYFINSDMEFIAKADYEFASPFFDKIAAVTSDDHAYFVDQKGGKYLDTASTYEKAYSFSDNLAVVVEGGKYYYVNSRYQVVLGPYEYASTFSNQTAAVKQNGSWHFIDTTGHQIGESVYEDVILDEENRATNKGRAFVREGKSCYMVDTAGKKISQLALEDAKPFYTDGFTAVKADGLWGFMGTDGKMYIEPQYEDARSFGNSVGAVCVDGLWGFVNSKNRHVIEPVFEDAKSLGSNKIAPVKVEGRWRFLKLIV